MASPRDGTAAFPPCLVASRGLGSPDIVLLWLLIAATRVSFSRVRSLASALLIPHLCRVGFVAALNFASWSCRFFGGCARSAPLFTLVSVRTK